MNLNIIVCVDIFVFHHLLARPPQCGRCGVRFVRRPRESGGRNRVISNVALRGTPTHPRLFELIPTKKNYATLIPSSFP